MEASLKQLRIRFTASMGLLSGVLLLLLSVILCLAVFVSAELTSATILETMLDRPDDEVVDERGRPSFLFAVTAEGNVTVMPAYADRLNIYGDNADEIIRSAVAQGDGKFSVDGMYFRVRSQEGPMGTQIFAVIDRTSDRQNLVTVASLVVLIYITSLLVAVLFFYLYSSYALAPVAESMQKQRDLIANASHELKTPLTVIATNLAVMKSEPQSTIEENAKWMDAIEAQIKRMNGLIVSMLQLSKMENAPLNPVDVDLSEVTEGACLGFDALCFEKGLRLVTRIAPGIHVMGDRDALERMIASLIDNATKYCGEHGKIGLRLTADSKRARLSVMNTGEAVSEEDAKHVFDRFYRSDGARRNPDGNSFGLGLAIVKATVTAHGGTINCCGIEGKGTVFNITLPLAKTSARKTEQKGATPVNDSEDELRSCTGEALFLTSDDEPSDDAPGDED